MGVKHDPELRLLADEACDELLAANDGRYTLAELRAEVLARIQAQPLLLKRHHEELADLIARDADERRAPKAQLSFLDEDNSVESEIWRLGDGLRVIARKATFKEFQQSQVVDTKNFHGQVAAYERRTAERAALTPYFTSPNTTFPEARAAYLAAIAQAA